MLRQQQMEQEE